MTNLAFNPAVTGYYDAQEIYSIPAQDLYTYNISQHFDETYEFIDRQLKLKRNTLVHCHAGVSRSVAIVTAYLMRRCSWTV